MSEWTTMSTAKTPSQLLMKKPNLIRTILLAGSLLLQLSTLCFHSHAAPGDVDLSFDPGSGVTNPVSVVVVQPEGKVLIGGPLTFLNGTNRYGSARLNADGSLDGTFISDTNVNADFGVIHYEDCGPLIECSEVAIATAATVQPDGKVLLGIQTNRVQYFLEDGQVHYFTTFSVARLYANGIPDSSFAFTNSGSLGRVSSIALQSDGKVIIGSEFYSFKIARLNADGSLDNSFNPDTGPSGGVSSVALQTDGKIIIAGGFSAVNGTSRNGIARLNANGSLDTTFLPNAGGFVASVALQLDGKVLVGGDFTSVNGTNRNRIARLNANGSLDSGFNPGTGADGVVRSVVLQPDGNVLIAGDFTTVNGVLRPHVARLLGDSAAPSLILARSNAAVILSWPVTGLNFQLQESTNLALADAWSPVAQLAVINGAQISVTIPASAERNFFRLKSQ